jgi:hypothetical protein
MSDFSDEKLSAWLDGELHGAEADAIAAAVENDPALAERLGAMHRADDALRMAFDRTLGSTPQILTAAIANENNVVAFKPEPTLARGEWMRIAATGVVALVIGAAVMTQLRPAQQTLVVADASGLTASATLAAALTSAHSGEASKITGGAITVAASFQANDSRYCREFHADLGSGGADAVACRDGANWRIEGWSRAMTSGGGYETAGGPDNPAIAAVIDKLGTKAMLDRAGEDKAIGADWSSPHAPQR